MKAPDKIYIQPNAHDKWWDGNKPNDNFQEYIHKDALLEWAENRKKKSEFRFDDSDITFGYDNALEELIDKLNEM